jgi:hypothetical protein
MRFLIIQRTETSDLGTFGALTGEGLNLRTGELPWRDNARGKSCIPAGEYECRIKNSPKFGPNTYRLDGVHGRTEILIHRGNFCGDEDRGHHADVDGCILLGLDVGAVQLPEAVRAKLGVEFQKGVMSSRRAMEQFMAVVQGEPITLQVVDIPKPNQSTDMV